MRRPRSDSDAHNRPNKISGLESNEALSECPRHRDASRSKQMAPIPRYGLIRIETHYDFCAVRIDMPSTDSSDRIARPWFANCEPTQEGLSLNLR
jgi:hypothetical protein